MELRRQDRKTEKDVALEILNEGEFGILSMSKPDNEGYGVPLNYVFDEDKIYFHCATEGSKLDYLSQNNKVSFCVVGRTKVLPSKFGTTYESVIVSGQIKNINADEKQEALLKIVEKYSADYKEEGKLYIEKLFDKVRVLKLSIEKITGKARKQ